jgi:RNA polymerase Rpb3/Rpb11 dimerisation domain
MLSLLNTSPQNLQIVVHHCEPLDCSFSLIGVDASIANAFRRILIAEIPTLAIEYVFVWNNTSIVQDEVLAHRLGLVPLKGSKTGLAWLKWYKKPTEEEPIVPPPNDYNTVVLKLQVECTKNPNAEKGETDPTKLYNNAHGNMELHPLKYRLSVSDIIVTNSLLLRVNISPRWPAKGALPCTLWVYHPCKPKYSPCQAPPRPSLKS